MMRQAWVLCVSLVLLLSGGKINTVKADAAGDLVSLVGVLCESEALVDIEQCVLRVRGAISTCARNSTTNDQFGQCILAGFPQVNSAMVGVEIPDWVWYLVRFFVPIDATCQDPNSDALVDLLCPYAVNMPCDLATISSAVQTCSSSVNSTEPVEQALSFGTCMASKLGSTYEAVTIPVVAWRQVLDPITGAILFVCDGILEVENSTQDCSAPVLTAVLDDCHSESLGSIPVFGACVATAFDRANISLPTSMWQMLYDFVTQSGTLHFPAACEAPVGSGTPPGPIDSTNTTLGSSNTTNNAGSSNATIVTVEPINATNTTSVSSNSTSIVWDSSNGTSMVWNSSNGTSIVWGSGNTTNTSSGSSNLTEVDVVGKPNSQVKVNDKVKDTLAKIDKKLVETCSPFNLDDLDEDLEDCAEALEKSSEKCKDAEANVAEYKSCIEVKMVIEVAEVMKNKNNSAASVSFTLMSTLLACVLLLNFA